MGPTGDHCVLYNIYCIHLFKDVQISPLWNWNGWSPTILSVNVTAQNRETAKMARKASLWWGICGALAPEPQNQSICCGLFRWAIHPNLTSFSQFLNNGLFRWLWVLTSPVTYDLSGYFKPQCCNIYLLIKVIISWRSSVRYVYRASCVCFFGQPLCVTWWTWLGASNIA